MGKGTNSLPQKKKPMTGAAEPRVQRSIANAGMQRSGQNPAHRMQAATQTADRACRRRHKAEQRGGGALPEYRRQPRRHGTYRVPPTAAQMVPTEYHRAARMALSNGSGSRTDSSESDMNDTDRMKELVSKLNEAAKPIMPKIREIMSNL